MSYHWGRIPPMTRLADWNRLAPNGPTGSFRDDEIRKMLPNGFKTYTLQQENELTAAQSEQIVSMEPKKTDTAIIYTLKELTAAQSEQIVSMEPEKIDTAIGSRYIEDVPLHTEVANVETIVTKYDQEVIELEKAIKILAEEIREMERKEAEALRMDARDVNKEEEDTKAYKVENNDNKKTKKTISKKKKEADREGSKTEKEWGTKGSNDDKEKEHNDRATKLVAGALKADAELEAGLSVAYVVKSTLKITQADHEANKTKVIVDNAINGAVNAMKMENNEMDVKAKEIADDAIRAAVHDIKDEKAKNKMEVRAKGIVDVAIKGAVKVMQIKKEKNEMEVRAQGIVDVAIKGAVKVMQVVVAVKKEVRKISKVLRKVGAAINVNGGANATDAGVDYGTVLGAMLGQNGYDHRRIQIHIAPERFTEKKRTDICQYWSEKLDIATTKNTKLHRDVIYFGRM